VSKFGFVGPSYTAKSNVVADEECINLFAETNETPGAQTQRSYFGTPGLAIFATFADGPVRGQCWTGSRLFAAASDSLYEVFSDGTFTVLGDGVLDAFGGPVCIVASNIQLLIVAGGRAYCYPLSVGTWTKNTAYAEGTEILDAAGHVQVATGAPWVTDTAYAVGAQIVDPNGNVQIAAQAVWAANTPYLLGAEIVDVAGHIQKASAAAWAASTTYVLGAEIVDSNGNIQKAYAKPWIANTAYAVGDEIVDLNGNVQKVTTAGISGAIVPAWGLSGTTADNTVIWTYQASAGGNAGTSGAAVPVWSTEITIDGTGTLAWLYQVSAAGSAGTSGAILPTFNDAGGSAPDGTGTLVWTDQGLATGAGTSGDTVPDFAIAGATPDSGTLVWNYRFSANGNAGTSGATIPTFSDTGGTVVDGTGTLTWVDKGLRLLDVTAQLAGSPLKARYSDGYFIVMFAGSNKFQISAILDGTTWPGIQVNAVSVFPENIVSIEVSHRELWVFGSQHAQPYQDTGTDEVFDVIPGALIETGCAATFTTDIVDNTVFWISEDIRGARQAWRASGYTPQRISTHAVETSFSSYTADLISNIVSYAYQDGGHLFWMLYIPGTDCTWCYDVAESLWHKRGEWHADTATYTPHRSWNHVYAFGKHLIGDWQTGNLWEMKLAYDTGGGVYAFVKDNDVLIRRLRRAPTLVNEMEWIYHSELNVDFATGLGPQPPLLDGNGNPRPPQAMLRWSNDRGSTWSNEHIASMGFAGEYQTRVIWRLLGRSRYRVYELSVSDPVPICIVDSYLKAS